jgi:hypothetical protein
LNGTVTVRGQERARPPIPSSPRRQTVDPCNKVKLRQVFLLLFVVLLGQATIAADQPAPQSIILASILRAGEHGSAAWQAPPAVARGSARQRFG